MYDFNPLASLLLVRSLPADLPLPSVRGLLARLKERGRRPKPAEYRFPTPHARARYDRAYPGPTHASPPSYNLTPPVPSDAPTRS